jgi:alkyl sulfatase BDS1-like metallo-beta-lactamase superfamily hydrolase
MGSANVIDILTSVRDALEYIRDQTIRGMNKGYTADELAQMITLPKHLADHPWLTQGRGLVSWFVKEIYNGYVGWYEGDPAFLNVTSLIERSKHIVDGFGGIDQTLLKVREAIEKGKEQWASELATYVLKVDPGNIEAKLLKAHALRIVGQRMPAADGRHWYLTAALELEGKIKIDPDKFAVTSPQQLAALPVDNLLEILATKIDPVKAEGVNKTLAISIPDIGKNYILHVRNGVLAVVKDTIPQKPDMSLSLDLETYKSLVNGAQKVVDVIKAGKANFEGIINDLEKFTAVFDPLFVYNEEAKP